MKIIPIFNGTKLKKLFVFAFLLFFAKTVTAQIFDHDTNLRSLVSAEHEFSQVSEQRGTRAAFIAFLADDGVIFNPAATLGKPLWLSRKDAPGVLTWNPVWADVSVAGDLGYTTGPYEFRQSNDEPAVGNGYYLSIWRKDTSGVWKVVCDIGTRNASPQNQLTLAYPLKAKTSPKKIDLESERVRLLKAETRLAKILSGNRKDGDLFELLGEQARAHRMNKFPISERAAIVDEFRSMHGKFSSKIESLRLAKSGDLAYTYGTYELKESGAPNEKVTGSFVRIWQREKNDKWKIAVDVLHAAAPKKPENKQLSTKLGIPKSIKKI